MMPRLGIDPSGPVEVVSLAAGSAQANRARGAAGQSRGTLGAPQWARGPWETAEESGQDPKRVFEHVSCRIWVGGK